MIEEFWDGFSSNEKEQFQRVSRRLLKNTFIVRDKDDESRKMYYFVSKNREALSEYFKYIGFDIFVDNSNGVVMLQNDPSISDSKRIKVNRVQLRKFEGILLCCFWTLYADRVAAGSLRKDITVSVMDLRFELEKYGLKDAVDNKALMQISLDTFKKYDLVNIVGGKLGEPDCRICIYPSIQFALNGQEFTSFIENATKRFADADVDDDYSEDEEEADE